MLRISVIQDIFYPPGTDKQITSIIIQETDTGNAKQVSIGQPYNKNTLIAALRNMALALESI